MKDQMNEVKHVAEDRTRVWSSSNMQQMMEIFFDSSEQFQQFQLEMSAEWTMSETSGYVLNNSRIAERLVNQDELAGLTLNEFSSVMQANKLDLMARGENIADDYLCWKEMRQVPKQLGPRLTAQGTEAIEQQFRSLQNYMALQNMMAQERARWNMVLKGVRGRFGVELLDDWHGQSLCII